MKQITTRQDGLSLVELMVALVLGLLITGAALQMLLTNRTTLTTQQSTSETEENGRYALDFILKDIRKAGMRPGTMAGTIGTPIVGVNGANNDEISVTYVVDSANLNAPAADCNGTAITGINPTITNRYYVDSGRLMCLGSGSPTPGVVIDGVDVFQVLYGIDGNTDGNIAVTQWINTPAATNTVIAVRVGLLVHSDNTLPNLPEPMAIDVLGQVSLAANSATLNDGRIRRLFVGSTLLRNNLDADKTNF